MRLLGKSITNVTAQDVEDLVENKVTESITREYKVVLPGNSDSEKKEFLADVSALANTLGGTIVYGILEEKDEGGQNTGIPESIVGLGQLNLDKVKLRLENMLRDGLEPRLPSVAFESVDCDGKTVLLLGVSRSILAPHMVSFQRDGKFYRHNNAGKYQMDVHEIRQAFLETEEFARRAKEFRDERVAPVREFLSGPRLTAAPRLRADLLHIVPLAFSRSRIDLTPYHSRLNLHLAPPGAGGWNHRPNSDGFLVYHQDSPAPGASHIQYFRDGCVEVLQYLENEDPLRGGALENKIVSYVRKILEIYPDLGVEPPVAIFCTLLGVGGAAIAVPQNMFGPSPNQIDRSELFLPDVVLEDFAQDIPSALRPMFDAFWQSAGWDRSPLFNADGTWKGQI